MPGMSKHTMGRLCAYASAMTPDCVMDVCVIRTASELLKMPSMSCWGISSNRATTFGFEAMVVRRSADTPEDGFPAISSEIAGLRSRIASAMGGISSGPL